MLNNQIYQGYFFTLKTLEQTKLSKYLACLSDWRRCVQFITPIQSLSLKCIGKFSGICVYIEVWKCGHSGICCYQLIINQVS